MAGFVADEAVFHGTIGGIDEGLELRGPEAFLRYFNDTAGVWESWEFVVEEVHAADAVVVVFWRETYRTRHSEIPIVNKTAAMFRIRDGKIVEGGGYMDRAKALEAAGLG